MSGSKIKGNKINKKQIYILYEVKGGLGGGGGVNLIIHKNHDGIKTELGRNKLEKWAYAFPLIYIYIIDNFSHFNLSFNLKKNGHQS